MYKDPQHAKLIAIEYSRLMEDISATDHLNSSEETSIQDYRFQRGMTGKMYIQDVADSKSMDFTDKICRVHG